MDRKNPPRGVFYQLLLIHLHINVNRKFKIGKMLDWLALNIKIVKDGFI